MTKHFRVLLAVDPAPQHKDLQLKTARALNALLQGLDAEVEPVTVVSPDQIRVPADLFHLHSAEDRAKVERTVNAWASAAQVPYVLPARVLVQEEFSVHRSTARLLRHAQEVGANLIALGTSARAGLARAVLGSFAESVALQSETPLFVVSPETRPLTSITRVLFPTDFGEAGRIAFDAMLPVVAAKGARLTLFHKLDYVAPETQDLFAKTPRYRDYMEQDIARKRQIAEEWKGIASREGVAMDFVLDESSAYVTDAILRVAEDMQDAMVAMASQRGRAAVLLGSVTRDLLRRSPDPVWVIHPHIHAPHS